MARIKAPIDGDTGSGDTGVGGGTTTPPSGGGGTTPPPPPPPIVPGGAGAGLAAGAALAALAAGITVAMTNMQATQEKSQDPLPQFSQDLAKAIADYVKSMRITPEVFKVNSGTIVTVGSATTQTGPAAPTPLQTDKITLGSMNPNA